MKTEPPRTSDDLDPFARLHNTHTRIEERLAELSGAAADLGDGGKRYAAQQTVRDVVGFLARAGRKHVDDEEQTLFPRLRAEASLQPLLVALEAEHGAHNALEQALRSLVDGWGDEGPDAAGERQVVVLARQLSDVYRAHIKREEDELFPAARAVLAPQVLAAMGQEMMDRRPNRGQHRL